MEGQRILGFVNSSVSFVTESLLCRFFFFDVLLFCWLFGIFQVDQMRKSDARAHVAAVEQVCCLD